MPIARDGHVAGKGGRSLETVGCGDSWENTKACHSPLIQGPLHRRVQDALRAKRITAAGQNRCAGATLLPNPAHYPEQWKGAPSLDAFSI